MQSTNQGLSWFLVLRRGSHALGDSVGDRTAHHHTAHVLPGGIGKQKLTLGHSVSRQLNRREEAQ